MDTATVTTAVWTTTTTRTEQAAIMRAARAVGLASVADALLEHLHVCCSVALGLLLVAAACPHILPVGSGASRLVQAALVAVTCPLVGVTLTHSCSFVSFEF